MRGHPYSGCEHGISAMGETKIAVPVLVDVAQLVQHYKWVRRSRIAPRLD